MLSIIDEAIGAVPILNDIQSFLNFTSDFFVHQIIAEKDRFHGASQFGQRFVRWMLLVLSRKPFEDRFRFGRSQPQGRRIFHHLIILLERSVPNQWLFAE